MLSIERKVGRLVEIRAAGEPDMKQFGRVIALANEVAPDAKVVVLVDARQVTTMSQEYVEKLGLMIRSSAQRLEQAVVVRRASPIKDARSAQLTRVAGPVPQQFTDDPAQALAALAKLVNPAELARAKQFLEEA
jgi:hypothetical protein